jgi:hypothetical protein
VVSVVWWVAQLQVGKSLPFWSRMYQVLPFPSEDTFRGVLALAFRCRVLMYKVAVCHPSTLCYVISGTLFPISGGRPAVPVPSPAAFSLFPLLYGTTHDLRPARPTCNYLFPVPTRGCRFVTCVMWVGYISICRQGSK